MRKTIIGIFTVIGFLVTFYSIYIFGNQNGYEEGQLPTLDEIETENKRNTATDDLFKITDKYSQLYNLCELKFKEGLAENFDEAYQYKGQMTAIEEEIQTILDKYEAKNKKL